MNDRLKRKLEALQRVCTTGSAFDVREAACGVVSAFREAIQPPTTRLTSTYTYVTMGVSEEVYKEIRQKLEDAGYGHAIMDGGVLNMHGLALELAEEDEDQVQDCMKMRESGFRCHKDKGHEGKCGPRRER